MAEIVFTNEDAHYTKLGRKTDVGEDLDSPPWNYDLNSRIKWNLKCKEHIP